eukprot:GHVU01096496.1.p2 GENE.GHVU01096496.1~~GHVU01096496.1.p2  ORF type:complete len:170 (+),score=19.99 GHVU01096496.1:114-623(+)
MGVGAGRSSHRQGGGAVGRGLAVGGGGTTRIVKALARGAGAVARARAAGLYSSWGISGSCGRGGVRVWFAAPKRPLEEERRRRMRDDVAPSATDYLALMIRQEENQIGQNQRPEEQRVRDHQIVSNAMKEVLPRSEGGGGTGTLYLFRVVAVQNSVAEGAGDCRGKKHL